MYFGNFIENWKQSQVDWGRESSEWNRSWWERLIANTVNKVIVHSEVNVVYQRVAFGNF